MPTLLEECPGAVGFMGSDRYDELDEDVRRRMEFYPVAQTAIRFAMATTKSKVERLKSKLERPEPLVIATSYPRRAQAAIAQKRPTYVSFVAPPIEAIVFGGSIESKPEQIERVDGIFDIVDTGNTIRANDLQFVADNMGKVALGAVWRRDVE